MKFRLVLMAALAFLMLASASPTLASGGLDSGGSGGGGGGGTTALPPCALISSFKATGGNYKTWGAIWVSYTVKNCGPLETLRVEVTETSAGNPDWTGTNFAYLKTNDSYSVSNIDNDFAMPGTTYSVTIRVTEYSTGALLATQTVSATTGTKVGP